MVVPALIRILPALFAVALVGIPIFIFGIASVVAFMKLLFTVPGDGTIPIWSLFVIGFIILFFLRSRRR